MADVRAELLEGYLDVDNAETVRWYRLAADRGLAGAQVNLGRRYENSVGVPQDNVQAHMSLDPEHVDKSFKL